MTFHVLNHFSRRAPAEFLTMWFRDEGFIWHPSHHFDFEFAKEDWIQPLQMELPPGGSPAGGLPQVQPLRTPSR